MQRYGQPHILPKIPVQPSPTSALTSAISSMAVEDDYVKLSKPPLVRQLPAPSSSSLSRTCPDPTSGPSDSTPMSPANSELIALYRSKLGTSGGAKTKHYPSAVWDIPITVLPSSSPIMACNSVAQGANWFQRIGSSFKMHHLTVRGTIQWRVPSSVAGTGTPFNTWYGSFRPVRVVIFVDTMPQLVAPLAPTLNAVTSTTDFAALLMNAVAASSAVNVDSPYNFNTHGFRYKILRDDTYSDMNFAGASSNTTFQGGIGNKHFVHHIDLKGLITTISDTGAVIPDTNYIYVSAFMDDYTGLVGPPPVQYPVITLGTDLSFSDVQ